jgi:two-component system OmpR family response regulator
MKTADDRPFSELRVLVVDDQKFIRGMVAQGLKANGAQVVEASDGFEALTVLGIGDQLEGSSIEALKRQRPDMFQNVVQTRKEIDVIVSDIRMLPMNGLEMLKAIRSGLTAARRDLPVVIMSAHSDEALIGAAIALDAHGYVAKPVSQKAISDRIVRALTMLLKLKPADAYRMLIIPELDAATLETDVGRMAESLVAVIRAGDVAIASGQRAITVKWHEIVLGDVLNENFTTKSGRLVAPAGTRVTEVLLAALQDLSHVTELSETASVRRKVI